MLNSGSGKVISSTAPANTSENTSLLGEPLSLDISRDEMNLAEFPLAVLSTRVNPNVKTLEFSDTHRTKNGEILEKKWIITGADKFGLPTSTDDDVVLGLMRLTMDRGFRERKVYFSRYELLRVLRWSTEGRSYKRLTKSLDRLSGVRIRATNAFYDNQSKSHQTCNFGIIDAYEINDARGSAHSDEKTKSFFIWSEVLFDSFKSGFVKKLDLNLYFTLRSAVSRRLYRYLDKHFYFRPYVERNLTSLAFDKLGLSRSYKYVSSIKQQLEPAVEELIKLGFLKRIEYSGSGTQTLIKFIAPSASSATAKEPEVLPANSRIRSHRNALRVDMTETHTELVEALVSRGIAYAQATRLIGKRSIEECDNIGEIISYYDTLVENKDHKVSRNRIGFLYRAVESPEKFIVPPPFKKSANKPQPKSRVRPEHKIHRAGASAPQTRTVGAGGPSLIGKAISSGIDVGKLRVEIEQKLQGMQDVIGEERYRELLQGCIEDELSKRGIQ